MFGRRTRASEEARYCCWVADGPTCTPGQKAWRFSKRWRRALPENMSTSAYLSRDDERGLASRSSGGATTMICVTVARRLAPRTCAATRVSACVRNVPVAVLEVRLDRAVGALEEGPPRVVAEEEIHLEQVPASWELGVGKLEGGGRGCGETRAASRGEQTNVLWWWGVVCDTGGGGATDQSGVAVGRRV